MKREESGNTRKGIMRPKSDAEEAKKRKGRGPRIQAEFYITPKLQIIVWGALKNGKKVLISLG